MKIIGLTGGIASGKSTVTNYLRQQGYTVVDCDKIAWELAEPDRSIWQIYFARYGSRVINPDRSLNRQAVADIVFNNKNELSVINSLVHPLIKEEMLSQVEEARSRGEKYIFLDVPLLFEASYDKITDETWLVYVPRNTQLKRLMARNHYSREEAIRRIDSQMSLEEKKKLSDVIINNNADRKRLRSQLEEKLEKLMLEGE
ncbi:Dephospho-CoA kinase [Anaerovibrio sp. JC8]|uniref:dephospho-CoA kinase n=1 Tax=Anaerovibrio sp. JC8 TaxID=1240085 RepID=UPI000A0BCD03|nr:dephospho-CoA kinase [Anaerovibrio sp. JC8]ORT99773.1 Dephospho-CoA kinase [Anaerovibrio sp. JC8]